MTPPTVQTELIPADLVAILQILSSEQRQQVVDFAKFLVQKQEHAEPQVSSASVNRQRIRDLDRGAVLWMSDDFDDDSSELGRAIALK